MQRCIFIDQNRPITVKCLNKHECTGYNRGTLLLILAVDERGDIPRYCCLLRYWYCACSYHDNDTITIYRAALCQSRSLRNTAACHMSKRTDVYIWLILLAGHIVQDRSGVLPMGIPKSSDQQAHNATQRVALWACRSAVFSGRKQKMPSIQPWGTPDAHMATSG